MLHVEERSMQARVDGKIEVLDALVDQRHARLGSLSVVNQNIELAELVDALGNGSLNVVFLATVGNGIAALNVVLGGKLGASFLQTTLGTAGDEDIGAVLGHLAGNAEANTLAAACYDCDASVQKTHNVSPNI